jgi:hypothetical protein
MSAIEKTLEHLQSAAPAADAPRWPPRHDQ